MFKKLLNNAANSIKNEIKEEFGIKNRNAIFNEVSSGVDEIKDAIKTDLNESKLNDNDVAEISDVVFLGNTKLTEKVAGGFNQVLEKINNKIPEESLLKRKTVENEKQIIREEKIDKVETKKINKNEMLGENLNSLIEFALADGELSEKEKQILFKKAELEGMDLDEFEIILEAKLFQTKQTQTPPKPVENINVAPKSDKFGDIKKCPSCGAIVESFSTNCKDCNYDFKNINANNTIERLFSTLEQIELSRKTGIGSFLGATYGMSVPDTDKRKIEAITSFPIPNTKEDILEFLLHSIPRIRFQQTAKIGGKIKYSSKPFNSGWLTTNVVDNLPNLYAQTWQNKCSEVIYKARFAMKDDKKTLSEIENYAQQIGL